MSEEKYTLTKSPESRVITMNMIRKVEEPWIINNGVLVTIVTNGEV